MGRRRVTIGVDGSLLKLSQDWDSLVGFLLRSRNPVFFFDSSSPVFHLLNNLLILYSFPHSSITHLVFFLNPFYFSKLLPFHRQFAWNTVAGGRGLCNLSSLSAGTSSWLRFFYFQCVRICWSIIFIRFAVVKCMVADDTCSGLVMAQLLFIPATPEIP